MRSEYLGDRMPNKPPMTVATVVICLLFSCTIIGVLLVPHILLATYGLRVKKVAQKWQAECERRFIRFIGKKPQYIDTAVFGYEEGFRGTGIAYSDGKIYLMQAGFAAEFEWDEVRNWSYNVKHPDQLLVTGSDMRANSHALIYNTRSAGNAAKESGFFLKVSSIEAPTWQFTTSDLKICEQWFEIFNQLSEHNGRLAA